jgi:hypothetical protein
MSERIAKHTSFDDWVSENKIPTTFEYGKGWWDYVELVQKFGRKFDSDDVRVVGRYTVRTPPPEEELPMPAVVLERAGILVALKWDFGATARWPREWTVTVRRRSAHGGPTFGLLESSVDLRRERVEGFAPELVFGPFHENPAAFSVELEDEWDVATLLRVVFHEA